MKTNPSSTLKVFVAISVAGILLRLLIAISAGNQLVGHLSGGGDAPAYVRLGNSLYAGKGFSYVGQPSAFRPPLYPLLLAAMHFAVGQKYLLAMRIIQLFAGIATAWLSALIAKELWGPKSKAKCFALVLIFPTLVFFTGEILTETIASLFTVAFFYFLVCSGSDRIASYLGMGVVAGIAALLRFNMVFLPLIAAWRVATIPRSVQRPQRLLIVTLVPALLILPWIVRNLVVFHGEVLYSTHTGIDLVEGIIEPEGRGDSKQQQQIIREAGWVMQGLERDDSRRLLYGSEPSLNRQALQAGIRLWRESWSNDCRVILKKLGYFWLSTDQLISIRNFSYRVRFLRISGVVFYWFSLGVAAIGLRKLFRTDPSLATTFVIYFSIATCVHLFFAMNTRLRVPLFDPLICILMSFPFLGDLLRSNAERISEESILSKQ
jgi:4-amino-4-deoxy-L-arabinose transferase-like glycosyltransferase